MAWYAVGTLTAILLFVFSLYRRGLNERNHLANFILLVLLDEDVFRAQRDALKNLVLATDAKNAGELGYKVNLATTHLADRLSHTMLWNAGLLWKLKQTGAIL